MKATERKKAVFEAALMEGLSVKDAGARAGIKESTCYRYLNEGSRERVNQATAEAVEAAARQLSAKMSRAADTLIDLLDADSDTARLGAAREIFDTTAKLREQSDLEARVIALEQSARR
jgi:transposase